MDFHELPIEVKHDIEDQSLSILEIVKDDIVVIGGWAVRALVGEGHLRFTWDIDGVVAEENIKSVESKLIGAGLKPLVQDWGVQFHHRYAPRVEIRDDEVRETVDRLELRIELSEPRMREPDTPHFFEFDLAEFLTKEICYHEGSSHVLASVPPHETMAANKLGLPADSKNNFDVAVLLESADLDKVIDAIRASDAWYELVLRRTPKRKGRMKDLESWERSLARDPGVDVGELLRKLEYIEGALRERNRT